MQPNPIPNSAPLSAEDLFRRHAPFVVRFARRLGVGAQEVDDVLQEVFLTAHRRGGYEPGPATPTTWLAEIAVRVVSTRRRATRRRDAALGAEREIDSTPLASPGMNPFDALSVRRTLADVQHALEGLDLDQRVVFVLFELEGQSCQAIAEGLSIPIGTVYSRLSAARAAFRRVFDRLGNGPHRRPVDAHEREEAP